MREVVFNCGNCIYASPKKADIVSELGKYLWCDKHKKTVWRTCPACNDHIETVKSYREHQSKEVK